MNMQVLSGKADSPDLPENVNWVSRAMLVYRQGLSAGLRPSLKVLDRLLSCLRLPFIPPLAHGLPSHSPLPQQRVCTPALTSTPVFLCPVDSPGMCGMAW